MKIEIHVIPVSDVDRAKAFYTKLGWRIDIDLVVNDQFRVIQFTPPGSSCSVIFGKGVTSAVPGSSQEHYLIVSDIEATRSELIKRGIEVSKPFYDAGGVFHHAGTEGRVTGLHPQRQSYATFATFSDPDGNGWLLQEVTERLPGRVDAADTVFKSAVELASALRRAASAHDKYEKQLGKRDTDWPTWYAQYIIREQAGESLLAQATT
jgi:predicted enzyme related to lactoylglutathione lyase